MLLVVCFASAIGLYAVGGLVPSATNVTKSAAARIQAAVKPIAEEAQTRIRLRQRASGGGTPADEYAYYCQGGGYAGTGTVRTVAGFTDTDVQAKIDLSANGDIVCLPSGTYTFSGANNF